MSADLFICPNDEAPPITVPEIQDRFVKSQLPCNVDTEAGAPWLVFDGHQSDLVFTVTPDGYASSAVLQAAMDDAPDFADRVFEVFNQLGWSYIEDTF
jgi:hypothetical protein